ncbi:MAG: MBL fold metallo-hydrolase [Candidatus Poseidoniaceae archaeon]|nr:MBL fold metallo-hydrolase [Candidatus Poseidoniaceae archaeon]
MQVEDIRPEGWACTYLVSNDAKAVLIDPVWDYIGHYESILASRNLKLVACMATHTHADHITACFSLSQEQGIPFYMWKDTASLGVTDYVDETTELTIAGVDYSFHHVPGHTSDSMIIAIDGHIFTGDFLFNGGAGVGRDDLPSGRLHEHWESIQSLAHLSDDVMVCSGHEPPGTELQTLGWNRIHNPILNMHSFDDFVQWQDKTAEQLGSVSKIKTALPANLFAEIPDDIPWLSQ